MRTDKNSKGHASKADETGLLATRSDEPGGAGAVGAPSVSRDRGRRRRQAGWSRPRTRSLPTEPGTDARERDVAAAAPSGVDAAPRDHQRDPRIPLALAKTAVCRRVPPSVRARLDQALLAPPEDCLTLEAIADRFQLQSRYGLSPKALKTYAARLQELIRPSVTSHLIAAVLGLLPQDYRDRLLAGTQVLFLSRLAQALNLEHEDALSVGELAKLASILGQLGGPRAGRSNAPAGRRLARPGAGLDADRNQEDTIDAGNAVTSDVTSPVKLAEAVRAVYGIDWPGGPK